MPEELVPSTLQVVGNDVIMPTGGKLKELAAGTAQLEATNRAQLDGVAFAAAAATAAEASRATAAEGLLSQEVTAEADERLAQDENLQTQITFEQNRAVAREGELQGFIDTETVRATGAEAALDTRVDALEAGGPGPGGGVPPERTLGFLAPAFTGAGDLSQDRLIAPVFGELAGTFCEGNDPRLAGLGADIVFGDQAGEVCEGNDPRVVAAVPNTRAVTAGTGLTGGGDLSVDRTLTVAYGATGTTACVGNDARLSNTRTPTAHAASHAGGGADAIAVATTTVAGLLSGGDKTKIDALPATSVPATRTLTASTGLTGGGDLSANRSFACSFGTTTGTVCQGDDTRVVNAVQTSRQILAGTGLTGGGTLAADRTLTVAYGTTATTACVGNDARVVGAVQTTRQVIAGTGLTGGGALSADVTLTVGYGTSATTACVGNDARLSNARAPTAHAASHVGGADAIAVATTSVAGLLSSADKTKIDALPATSVPSTRAITAGTGLTGGGDLSADRSLAVSFGTAAGTACEGNDARLSKNVTLTPVAATYNLTSADNGAILQVDTTAARTINLPAPSAGFNVVVKDVGPGGSAAFPISLVRSGAELIEGVAATKTLTINRGAWFVYSDGTNWFVNGPS